MEYHAFRQAREAGGEGLADRLLEQIRDYNQYDCDSTLALRDWLLARAGGHGVEPRGADPAAADEPERSDQAVEVARLEERLRDGVPEQDRSADGQARAMLAAAVGFNRREDKPFWWAHFDRLKTSLDDWPDQREVFVAESAELVGDWAKPTPRSRPHRQVRLVGRWGAGSQTGAGTHVKAVFDTPVDGCHDVPVDALLGCSRSGVMVQSVDLDAEGRDVVVIDETLPKDTGEHAVLPVALVPGNPVPMGNIDGAVREVAQAVLDAGGNFPPLPAFDLLRRLPPRLTSGGLPGNRGVG